MTTLHWALLLAGLIVLAVVAFVSLDRDQLRRERRRLSLERKADTVWIEGKTPVAAVLADAEVDEIDAASTEQEPEPAAAEPAAPLERTEIIVDRHVELVARLPGRNGIGRDTARSLYRKYAEGIGKPLRLLGAAHADGQWLDLEQKAPAGPYRDFTLTMQLADRRGPVSEHELDGFTTLVGKFAEVLGRRYKISLERAEALKQAEALDKFCKQYDAVAVLHIVARNYMGFTGRAVSRQAQELGLMLNNDRVYQKRGADGGIVYNLANMQPAGPFDFERMDEARIKGLSLIVNIPATREPERAFAAAIADGRELCRLLSGKLVDQNQRALSEQGIEAIITQIRKLAAEMEQFGVPAGGEAARRLFS